MKKVLFIMALVGAFTETKLSPLDELKENAKIPTNWTSLLTKGELEEEERIFKDQVSVISSKAIKTREEEIFLVKAQTLRGNIAYALKTR